MSAAFSMLLTIAAPATVAPQAPAPANPPSVTDAEANLQRAQQILIATRAFEIAERRRIAAEAETITARATLTQLQGAVPMPIVPTPPPAPVARPLLAAPVPDAVVAAQAGVVTTTTVIGDKQVTEVKPYSPPDLAASETGRQKFGGIEFGIGVAFSYDLGNHQRIKDAEIVDGLVRVTHTENVRARLILESHYFFTPRVPFTHNYSGYRCSLYDENTDERDDCVARRKNFGIGPFMALQPGTDSVIDAIGFGVMVGFRRREEKASSFNIGLGVLYDVSTQILGDGFAENRPPPGNETEVRFRQGSQSAFLAMTSYTF